MKTLAYRHALIVGAGTGISASLARRLAGMGVDVSLVARHADKLRPLAEETGARVFVGDASKPEQVAFVFDEIDAQYGAPDIVVYNAGLRLVGPLASLDPDDVANVLATTVFGAFLVTRQAARRMEPKGHGAILFTGATAGVKGFANSAPFAMGKFALRGLAQSAARELGPKGIHVAHFNIDGVVRPARAGLSAQASDDTLDPDAIAQAYVDVLAQPRSAWSHEIDLRPWTERF